MSVTFGVIYGMSAPNQLDVIKGVAVPELSSSNLLQGVGLIGAVIMWVWGSWLSLLIPSD